VLWDKDLRQKNGDFGVRSSKHGLGLDVEAENLQGVVQAIRDSLLRKYLLAALDHWAWMKECIPGQSGQALLSLAQQVDEDPWQHRLRKALLAKDGQVLRRLAEDPKALDQPPFSLYMLGNSLETSSESRKVAEKLLRQAQRRYSGDFWINFKLGWVLHLEYGVLWEAYSQFPVQRAESLGFFSVALALRPQSPPAHQLVGCALRSQGKLSEAIQEYCLALKYQPDYAGAHHELGRTLSMQGKLVEAIEEYRLALKYQPEDAWTHFDLGGALQAQGKLAEAMKEFRLAIKYQPDHAPAHNNLAWVLATAVDPRLRQPLEAVRTAQRAVELAPQEGYIWKTLGVALYRSGKPQKAIEALNKSVELKKGGDPFDYFFLGMAHQDLGDRAQARQWYDKAMAGMDNKNEELRRFQAEAAQVLGLPELLPLPEEEKPR
jgi:tetratricopeptide (TPR) repeat protein